LVAYRLASDRRTGVAASARLGRAMYLAVAAVILGQAAVLGRWVLGIYALVFGVTVWSFVHWYEEPTLRRQFGSAYDEYRTTVPGWWPRRP
jgi:protein-S-isoprenylcysteine O-methyltransferase Ste14